MKSLFPAFLLLALLVGCATPDRKSLPPLAQARLSLKEGRSPILPAENRAGSYLDAASLAAEALSHNPDDDKARRLYNTSSAELTDLLRENADTNLWNRPLALPGHDTTWQLRFNRAAEPGIWRPDLFTDFVPADSVPRKHLRKSVREDGLGGTLVGLRKTPGLLPSQRAPFEPRHGFVAPVTATVDFQNSNALLTLHDPAETRQTRFQGKKTPLASDFTAPIAFNKPSNLLWSGFKALIHTDRYLGKSGLYMLHPYDPNRIPVVLVHGLASIPQMWVNVINEVESDPQLRGRFQFWVFFYPTGNPVTYSALRCREELAKVQQLYPRHPGIVMIGHSMGGLVSRMQATTTGGALWEANLKERAKELDRTLPPDHIIRRALRFEANPEVNRIVFICVPHRGSDLALSSFARFATRLITLPGEFVSQLTDSIEDLFHSQGGKSQLPNSITSLSPKNPTLLALDTLPIRAPHHSIIGDRGRNDSPNSSDGIVPYWSSHLKSAESELVVPGPHGSHELPPTIEELVRILRLELDRRSS